MLYFKGNYVNHTIFALRKMSSTNNDSFFDIIIAGGGLAGLLALTRLRQIHPSAKILLLEKETHPGGRLRTAEGKENPGAGGLHYISRDLFDFLNRTLIGCAVGEDFSLPNQNSQTLGVLQGKKLDEIPLTELCSAKFAKIIGGNSAVKHWENFSEKLKQRTDDLAFQALGKTLNIAKKDPFLDVLNIMSIPLGILNPSFATLASFEQRSHYISQGLYGGSWSSVIERMIHWSEAQTILGKAILDSSFSNGRWELTLENEKVSAKTLVVAQSPWDTLPWLKRENAPGALVNTALKFSPMSVVSLVIHFQEDAELPDRILIPSEKSQVFQLSKHEYAIQVIIDYETFLDAPRVVQAVKQVKRSKVKICKQLNLPEPVEEFLSLRPIAWCHDADYDARKQVEDFDISKLNSKQLVFCGDAYGASYDPDQNLIKSVLATCSTLIL